MSRARDFANLISSGVLADGQISFAEITGVTASATEINYLAGVTSGIQSQFTSVQSDLATKVGTSFTGDVNITGEMLVDSYNETFKQPSTGTTASTFDWAAFTASGNTKSLTGTDRRGIIQWKPDGTRFFVNDQGGNDAIHQFNVSTAYDFSTASLVSSTTSNSAGFSRTNMCIVFSSDGQYLFGVERGTNSPLYRLTLNTAWSASGGSSSETSVRTLTSGGYTYCVDIADDGSKFYVLDDNDTISEYTFGTAYDPSTLGTTATATLIPTGGSGNVYQTFKFTNSGSNLLVLKNDGSTLLEYALSTPFDLSTVNSTPTQTLTVSTGNSSRALGVNPNKKHIYVVGNTGGVNVDIKEYSVTATLNTANLDCESANVFATTLSANTQVSFTNPPAGGALTVAASTDFSDWSYESKSFSVSSQDGNPLGLTFNSAGTKMYVAGNSNDYVYQYSLSTAWDVSTASYDSVSLNVGSQFASPCSLQFNADGTKLFVLDYNSGRVWQYGLTTAYDLSTASYDSVNLLVTSQGSNVYGMYFTSDGTKLYVQSNASTSNRLVGQYTLTTGFDLTTASYANKSFDTASQSGTKTNLALSSDGTIMFVVARDTDDILKYTLSTAYDVSTASYDSAFDFSSQDTNGWGFFFRADYQKLYLSSTTNDKVWQFEAATSSLNDSTAYGLSLKVVQDSGASGYTVTWPTSVKWPGGAAPSLSTTASAVDQFVFYTYDGGTNWYGFTAGQAIA